MYIHYIYNICVYIYIKHSYGKFWKPWRIDFRGFPFGTLFVFTVPGGLDEIFAEPMG